jgi:hypothetical protein
MHIYRPGPPFHNQSLIINPIIFLAGKSKFLNKQPARATMQKSSNLDLLRKPFTNFDDIARKIDWNKAVGSYFEIMNKVMWKFYTLIPESIS